MRKISIAVIGNAIYAEKIKRAIAHTDKIIMNGCSTTVRNGTQSIRAADVVLLDVDLMISEDISILETISNIHVVPIIMMADRSVNQTTKTVHAMSHGAVDFIKMREGKSEREMEQFEKNVVEKILQASRVRSSTQVRTVKSKPVIKQHMTTPPPKRKSIIQEKQKMIVIGSSTGGPRALQQLLQGIPKGFTTPIFIVQHMPSKFTKSLAARLHKICEMNVKEATHGETIQQGTVYIAPGNYHLEVKQQNDQLTTQLTKDKARLGHRPSVNTLLESIIHVKNKQKIVVILTGMGRDGAEGIKKLKASESETIIIAESAETAVINGMPNAAILTNCVTEVLRIEDIAEALIEYTNTRGS